MKKWVCWMMAIISAFSMALASTACSGKGQNSSAKVEEVEEVWDGVKVTDNTLVNVYTEESELINGATVVCDLTDKSVLDKLASSNRKPTNVILRISEKYNVLDINGNVIDSFADIYKTVLKGKIIPILYVKDSATAQAVDTILSERFDLLDVAVMSKDPALVEGLRKKHTKIRGILEVDSVEKLSDIVHTSNKSFATVVVLNQKDADIETVRYLQGRFKAVWVRAESSQLIDMYDCINSGAYGVISESYEAVYNALGAFSYSIARMPFNVAHRGLPYTHNENSISGTRAAVEFGATHVELDCYLTTDNRIVMMHNDSLGATSNGTGRIEEMSLEEIRQYQLIKFQPHEDIPTLEDVIDVLKGTNVILMLEIKSTKNELVDALKVVLEEQDFADQVVVISFSQAILGKMAATLPEIPTAFLGACSEAEFTNNLSAMGIWNYGVATQFANTTVTFNEQGLKPRGLIGWYWTFSTLFDVNEAFMKGYTGLTSDCADSFAQRGDRMMYVKGKEFTGEVKFGDSIELIAYTYAGKEIPVTGNVVGVKDLGDRYAVVASYIPPASNGESPALYTQKFYVSH